MKFNRRHFCSTLAIGSTGIVGGPVSAQSEIQVTGSIDSAVGATINGIELFFQQVDTGSKWTYTVPEDGSIDFTVSETGTYRVRLFNTSSRNEDVPLLYSFGQTTIEDGNSNVEYTIPEPYDTRIRCVDSDGNPVEGLQITLRAGGTGRGGLYTTSRQGYVRLGGTSETDIELRGPIDVEANSKQDSGIQELGTIDVVQSAEFELTVSNVSEYANATPKLVQAVPESGFNYPYYLFIPGGTRDGEVPLVVEPNNTGTSTDDFSKHRSRAFDTAASGVGTSIAKELDIPLLVPVFPRPRSEPVDYTYYTHQLDQDTLELSRTDLQRIDLQLLRMAEHAKTEVLSDTDYTFNDQLMLNGFSASGNFVDRFTVLHPDRVQSVTAGGLNGMALLPLESAKGETLEYHVGIADISEITGSAVDLSALDSVDQFLYMGGQDTNDTIPFSDAWTSEELKQTALNVYGDDMITERFPYSQDAYNQAGVEAQFRTYEGIGHRPVSDDVIEFHRSSLNGDDVTVFGQSDVSEYASDVELSDIEIAPDIVDSTANTHTLSFTAQNVSADGASDTFSITIPSSLSLTRIDSVTTTPDYETTVTKRENSIEFEINPNPSVPTVDINVTVKIVLARKNR